MSKRSISVHGDWTAVSRAYDDDTARNPTITSTDLRLMCAARARVEFEGHAHFKRGELAMILSKAKPDGHGGYVVERLSPSALNRAIDRMVGAGLLAPDSWSECLRLPPFYVQFGNRQGPFSTCPTKPKGNPKTLIPSV